MGVDTRASIDPVGIAIHELAEHRNHAVQPNPGAERRHSRKGTHQADARGDAPNVPHAAASLHRYHALALAHHPARPGTERPDPRRNGVTTATVTKRRHDVDDVDVHARRAGPFEFEAHQAALAGVATRPPDGSGGDLQRLPGDRAPANGHRDADARARARAAPAGAGQPLHSRPFRPANPLELELEL